MKSYKEYQGSLVYYFQESFSLRETTFGTNDDYNNGQFEKDHNIYKTYFIDGDTILKVDFVYDGKYYHVKFSYMKDGNFTYEMKYELESALKLYNKVMFIVSKFMQDYNINHIAFGAHDSNPKLKSLYNKMITNKSFLNMMLQFNFQLEKQEDDINFFDKVIK